MGNPFDRKSNVQNEITEHDANWAVLPPELLRDILSRIDRGDSQWPMRRNVVATAGVCKAWREIAWDLASASSLDGGGQLTFPVHLRQPGPRDRCIECFIRRNRKTGTYTLYLGLQPTPTESGKFLMGARKCGWRPSCTDYIVSLDSNNFSRSGNSYLGRLRANFLSTKFTIFDSSHPMTLPDGTIPPPAFASLGPQWGAACVSSPRPGIPAAPAVSVAYALNVLGTRGPRRIQCTLHGVASLEEQEEGDQEKMGSSSEGAAAGSASAASAAPLPVVASPVPGGTSRAKGAVADCSGGSGDCGCVACNGIVPAEPLVLKNKPPRWHEQLQCWCLNFRGRVTVASVKNFQLVEGSGSSDADKPVLLQFGKIGKDTFTMDYRYPLSAFQAFAICLSSFDTKVACE